MADNVDLNVNINLRSNAAGAKEAHAAMAGVKTEAAGAATNVTTLGAAHNKTSGEAAKLASATKGATTEHVAMNGATKEGTAALSQIGSMMGGTSKHAIGMAGEVSKAGTAFNALGLVGHGAGLLVAGGAAVAGAAVLAFAKQSADAYQSSASEIGNYKRIVGGNVEMASRQVEMFKLLGVAQDAADKSMSKLALNTQTNVAGLQAYGIVVAKDAQGNTDMQGTLENVAEAYKGTQDPAERAALLFAAFGKGGADMVPVLNQGRDGLRGIAAEMKNVYTASDLRAAKEYTLSQRELGMEWDRLSTTVGRGVVPGLNQLTGGMREASSGFHTLFTDTQAQNKYTEDLNKTWWASANPLTALLNNTMALGHATSGLNDKIIDNASKNTADAAAVEANADANKRLTDEFAKEKAQMDEINGAATSHVGSFLAMTAQEKAYRDILKDGNSTLTQREQAADQTATAYMNLKDQEAILAGHQLTAAESAKNYKQKLLELGQQASGQTRKDIIKLANEIKVLEDPVDIPITLNGYQLLLDKLHTLQVTARALEGGGGYNSGVEGSGPQNASPDQRIGNRAEGGPIEPGQIYHVGENGPELFVSRQAGSIIPHGQSERMLGGGFGGSSVRGGGGDITINITESKNARATAAEVRDELLRMKRNIGSLGLA